MPHDMTQTMMARLAQQAERAAKDKRKVPRQPIDNEDFRQGSENIFDQNANEPEEPDYRWEILLVYRLLDIACNVNNHTTSLPLLEIDLKYFIVREE